jgi:hypothetical protein
VIIIGGVDVLLDGRTVSVDLLEQLLPAELRAQQGDLLEQIVRQRPALALGALLEPPVHVLGNVPDLGSCGSSGATA